MLGVMLIQHASPKSAMKILVAVAVMLAVTASWASNAIIMSTSVTKSQREGNLPFATAMITAMVMTSMVMELAAPFQESAPKTLEIPVPRTNHGGVRPSTVLPRSVP